MTATVRRTVHVLLFVLLCSISFIVLAYEISGWGDNLSQVDPGSEANALREARHFLEDGVTKYYGLGNINYPGMYPTSGTVSSYLEGKQIEPAEADYIRQHVLNADGVYTHYPPGPEYLLYVAEELLGPVPVWRLRLLPLMIGWSSTIFLCVSVRRRFGPEVSWLTAGALVLTPSVTNAFVGLHDQGYALAFTMCEIAVAIGNHRRLIPFAILGFLQGWLTFDQVFLVSLIPLAIELAMPAIDPGYRPRWRLAARRVVLASGGFAFAHALHFLEVWAYFGSLQGAVADLAGAAAYRSGSGATGGLTAHLLAMVANIQSYFLGPLPFDIRAVGPDPAAGGLWPMFRCLGLSLGPWWAIITMGLIVWEKCQPGGDASAIRKRWHAVFAVGMVTSSLWFLVMVNHGGYHERFIYRHLFFLYFMCILFGAVTVCRRAVAASASASPQIRSDQVAAAIPRVMSQPEAETGPAGYDRVLAASPAWPVTTVKPGPAIG